MQTVAEKPKNRKQIEADRIEKERKHIAVLMERRAQLLAEKADMEKNLEEELAPHLKKFQEATADIRETFDTTEIKEQLKAAEEDIMKIAGAMDRRGNLTNRAMFDVSGNLRFEEHNHYLHITQTTVPFPRKGFSLSKFVAKFGDYVKVEYRIKELKALFMNADLRKKSKIDDYAFELKVVDEVEFKTKKQKEDEQEKSNN